MKYAKGSLSAVHALRFEPGEDVMASLQAYCEEHHIGHGTIVSGVDFASFRALLLANGWTVQTALCTLVLTVAHAPCSTTCLTILRETRSAKWTLAAVLIPAGVGLAFCILIRCMLASAG